MACNERDPNCQPCRDCPPSPDPVLPRCDVALTDGTFTNTTVVVEGGCITGVFTGQAPQYTPDPCCAPVGGGGGGGNSEPCDCPPGDPGENATIEIGAVQSVAPGSPATVVNTGTPSNAVLNFQIPRGDPGENAEGAGGVDSTAGGIVIEQGRITTLPAAWPPVLFINASTTGAGMSLVASAPDPTTGVVNLELQMQGYDSTLRAWVGQQIENATSPLITRIAALESQVSTLQSQVSSLQSTVSSCCP